MKKLTALVFSAFFIGLLAACSSGGDNPIVIPGESPISKITETYSYNSATPTFDVTDTTKKVIVNGAAGKKIYLAKYNLDKKSTPAGDIRVLKKASGLADPNASANVAASVADESNCSAAQSERKPRSLMWAWKPSAHDKESMAPISKSLSMNVALTPNPLTEDKEQIEPIEDSTTKDIYIPIDDKKGDSATFYIMTFVVRSVGANCIVWGPSETQSQAAQDSQANIPAKYKKLISLPDKSAGESYFTDAMADELKDKFEAAYPYETEMFGNKATECYKSHNDKSKEKVGIKKVSDTAEYTNIIVYDFVKSSNNQNLVGFFWNKDYRPNYKTMYGQEYSGTLANPDDEIFYYFSNEGNVIYLAINDIVFEKAKDIKKRDWVLANEAPGQTMNCNPDSYLTLCHEYMHSLQYARKNLEQNFDDWPVALGELLGIMCEDVMKDVLDVPPSYSVENYRLDDFCNTHYFSSVMDDNTKLSYANLLAFGIYLTRNYGGANLVSDIVKNDDAGDWSCITKAIKNVKHVEKTPDKLMREFLEQLLINGSVYTSNKDSDPIDVGGVNFTMEAINPLDFSEWFGYELANLKLGDDNYEIIQQVKNGVKTYDAKRIIKEETVAGKHVYDIRPRGGFNLHYIGTAQDDEVSLVFSDAYASGRHPSMMLVIGD